MRILYIFHTSSMVGGASKSGFALVKGLVDIGHEIYAVCPAEGELAEQLRLYNIPVLVSRFTWAFPMYPDTVKKKLMYIPLYFNNLIINKRAIKEITDYAKSIQPDIVHTNTSVVNIGLIVAKTLDIPHITHYREFGYKDCGAVMLHESKMRSYKKQYGIAITKKVAEFHMKKNRPKTKIIYNGIFKKDNTHENSNKSTYFLFVGGLFQAKGIEDLLIAYSMLPREQRNKHNLMIAGSTAVIGYRNYLFELADKLNITNDVKWLGERNDISNLMNKAYALIVPSHNEAFGRIVVEGMANGCLVVGRDREGIKEQFDNGMKYAGNEIGLRFETVNELYLHLENICNKGISAYTEMINRASSVISQLYSTESYIENVEFFYTEIINENYSCNRML